MRIAALLAFAAVVIFVGLVDAPPSCDDIIFSVDVSTTLGSTTLQKYQAIECKTNSYQSPVYFNGQGLTSATNVVSVATLSELKKGFIFTTDASFTVSSTYCPGTTCTFSPRDIVKAECVTGAIGSGCTTEVTGGSTLWNYSLYKSSATLGLPSGTVIDALAFDTDGKLLMSFDASTTLPTTSGSNYTFLANDIVKLSTESPSAKYSMFLQGGALGLSAGTNVVGFDMTDSNYYFMFETAAVIGGQGFRSGTAYKRGKNASAWSNTDTLFSDSAFPSGSYGTDFSLVASPAVVGSVRSDGSANVQVTKSGSNLSVSWESGCAKNVTGYAVYEGTLGGTFTNHVPATTDGVTQICSQASSPVTVQPTSNALGTYYLVVPVNDKFEGSYGTDSSGNERSQSASPCQAKQKKAKACS